MLGLVIDEELGVVDCFGQRSVLVPKLCKVQPGGGEDKPRVPDGMIAVRVTCIEWSTGRYARLGSGEEPTGHRVGIIVSSRKEAVHKGGHGSDGSVLTRCIVDVVPSFCRFACSIHPSRNQLSLTREEGEEYSGGHGEEVKVATLGQRVGRQPVRELLRSFTRKGGSPGRGRTLNGELAALT